MRVISSTGATDGPGRPRLLAPDRGERARQRGRAVGAGAGVERARRRAVRPGRDDAVGGHPAGAARAGDRGERPRPGRGLGDADDLVGAGPAQRPADHGLHALPLGGRRGRGPRSPRTSADVRTARDVIPYDGRTYRYTATVTNGAGLESPQANSQSFTSIGQPSTPSLTPVDPRPRRPHPADRRGRPAAGRRASRPSAGVRGTVTVGHLRVRVRPRQPGGVQDHGVRHEPDQRPHHHRLDGQLGRQRVRAGHPPGHALPRHPDADRLQRQPQRCHRRDLVVEPARPTGGRSTRCSSTGRSTAPSAATRPRRPSTAGRAPTSCGCGPTRPPAGRAGPASSR